MSHQPNRIFEFGPYRLDAVERLLWRDRETVPLQPKVFDLLLVLVEHHGHLLEKDELMKSVWPDTMVEEANLANNISILRKALGESGQQFIETVPKRGYRFVANVRELAGERAVSPHATSNAEYLSRESKHYKRGALFALVALIVALGWVGFGIYRFLGQAQSPGKDSRPEPRTIPITSFQGIESQPAFSPDGNQIAFVWGGEKGDNLDIYVKLADAGAPLRLTTDPGADTSPAWSPDGRYLAFLRHSTGSSGIYLVPALAGPERKLAYVYTEGWRDFFGHYLNWLSWSPNGKYLAIVDKISQQESFSIFLLSIETGEKQRLTSSPAQPYGDSDLAFSPDGKTLAFTRSSGLLIGDLYIMPLDGSEPRRLTFDNKIIIGLAWTSNSREIVFSSNRRDGFSLWRISASGGTPERVAEVGQGAFEPTISRQGHRLAYTQAHWNPDIWRMEIPKATGRDNVPTQLVSSTRWDAGPQFSPDGKRIAFNSDRSGSSEIYVCDSEGLNPIQLTSLGSHSGTARWSPDGRQIVFDSNAAGAKDIYVVNAEGGAPRRLTTEAPDEAVPSWSRDGRWVYFASNRSGTWQVYKVPAEGGQMTPMTKQGGFAAFESPDGMFVYYAMENDSGLWRVPVAGGEETQILKLPGAGYWGYWAVADQGIYYINTEAIPHPTIEFFNFATGRVRQIGALEKKPSHQNPGLTVSTNNRWVLFTQAGQSGSDVMLMESFR